MTTSRGATTRWLGEACGRWAGPFALALVLCILSAAPTWAGDVYSNGIGGGRWSDPGTWRGGSVPGPKDTVVIASRDEVVFDANHEKRASCAALAIDPKGVLAFKADSARHVLSVAGRIESFGTIRINTRQNPDAYCELRLTAETEQDRRIQLREGGAFLAYGHRSPTDESHTTAVTTGAVDRESGAKEGSLVTDNGKVMLDIQHTRIVGLHIHARGLDNTGYTANERVNIIGNHFAEFGTVDVHGCDTPAVKDNVFDHGRDGQPNHRAIEAGHSTLAQIHGNRIVNYQNGIRSYHSRETSIQDNVLIDTGRAIHVHASQAMVKDCTIRDASTGVKFYVSEGVVERTVVRGAGNLGWSVARSEQMQLTNCRIEGIEKPADQFRVDLVSMRMLNTNLPVKGVGGSQRQRETEQGQKQPLIESSYYLLAKVRGDPPAGAQLMVRTKGRDASKAAPDPNVRHAPAPLDEDGRSPRADAMRMITVRGPTLRAKGKVKPAPKYVVSVQVPSEADGKAPKVLASKTVQPDASWHRADPGSAEPNVTIELAK